MCCNGPDSRDKLAAVSVVVPVYSRVHLLHECLTSIRNQTFTDWECIVVDDASPVGEAIRSTVEETRDARFRYVRRSRNGGPAAARNTGVQAAEADYFICVDEDDRLVAEAAELLYREIQKGHFDAVCPQARLFGGATGTRQAVQPSLELMLQGMYLLPNGWIMRRSVWEKAGGYDEDPRLLGRDDWEIWLRILALGARVQVIDECLYEFRVPAGGIGKPGSLEHEARAREVDCMLYVMQKHAGLYRPYPHIRRALRLRSLRLERDLHQSRGNAFRAAWRAAQLAFYEQTEKEIRRAAKLALTAFLGNKAVDAVALCLRRLRDGHSA